MRVKGLTMKRLMVLVPGAVLFGCADGKSYVHVHVDGSVAMITSFNATVMQGGQSKSIVITPAHPPTDLPFDFSLEFSADRQGTVDVAIDAYGLGLGRRVTARRRARSSRAR